MHKQKGFTLIELLVVIAIIGLLSTLAVISLNNARQKSRDAKRMADIKQVQSALELYYNDQSGYPIMTGNLGAAANACLDSGGFKATGVGTCGVNGTLTIYMGQVPAAPTPPAGNVYAYNASTTAAYSIAFTLEGPVGALASGAHVASPSGIQ